MGRGGELVAAQAQSRSLTTSCTGERVVKKQSTTPQSQVERGEHRGSGVWGERQHSIAFGTGSAASDSEIPVFDPGQDGRGRCCVLPCTGTRHAAHHTTPLFPSCLVRHCCHSRPFPCSSQPDASRAPAPSWTEAAEGGGRDALSTALIRCVYPIPRRPLFPVALSSEREGWDGRDGEGERGRGGGGMVFIIVIFHLPLLLDLGVPCSTKPSLLRLLHYFFLSTPPVSSVRFEPETNGQNLGGQQQGNSRALKRQSPSRRIIPPTVRFYPLFTPSPRGIFPSGTHLTFLNLISHSSFPRPLVLFTTFQ